MTLTKVTNSMILGALFNPLDYGASENATASENAAAFQYALSLGNVEFPEGTFDINDELILENQIVYSNGCHLNYTNTVDDKACIHVKSNSKLLGTISITMPDGALGIDVNHLRVGGGKLPTDGANNVEIGCVTVYGGHATMAAVLVEGNSYDVYIKEINCPGTNDKIGQVFGCHWGNFQDHYLSGGVYVNTGLPTTHPRNIQLDRLIVGKLTNSDGIENCAAFISSSRDVRVGYVYVEEAAYAVTVYPGDIGFQYASAADQVQKMYGIAFGTIVAAKTRLGGVYVTGTCPYNPGNTYDNAVGFRANYINVTGDGVNTGLSTNRVFGVDIGCLKTNNYETGLGIGLLSRNVTISQSIIQSCTAQGILIAGTLGYECFNVELNGSYISDTNLSNSTNLYTGAGIAVSRAINVSITNGIVGTYSADPQYSAVNIASTCEDVLVENVKTYGSVSGYGFVFGGNLVDKVSFSNCSCSNTMTLRYGVLAGFSYDKKIVYSSSTPINGSWFVGDIVYNTSPTSGGYVGWVCTVAGTPGTWKTFGSIS